MNSKVVRFILLTGVGAVGVDKNGCRFIVKAKDAKQRNEFVLRAFAKCKIQEGSDSSTLLVETFVSGF